MLGCTVTDTITGFRGTVTVTGICHYITGCSQALVAPRAKDDNSFVAPEWIDLQRLHVNTDVPSVTLENGRTPGFDRAPPKR